MASTEAATVTATTTEAAPCRCISGAKSGDTENERRCYQSD
jgi:hypothetical protein